jgi:hypothetical protein
MGSILIMEKQFSHVFLSHDNEGMKVIRLNSPIGMDIAIVAMYLSSQCLKSS